MVMLTCLAEHIQEDAGGGSTELEKGIYKEKCMDTMEEDMCVMVVTQEAVEYRIR